ncbi:MAG: D-alanyl-D-alanine carboxypeptidase/D-alanyl-D-alanine-endopeptidase [Phaeodactylibacter sp.]|uniref:D-alanyl-D-alanine carboxypeptidase/D-alanyl-D-alanine endopeptidase n=1 Tax=Phaeodactylibacter sp. TaxID=1940289 RepID=UPI0032EF56EA
MYRYLIAALYLLSFGWEAGAQSSWQKAADQLASHPALKHGSISLCVIDIASGKTVAQVDPGLSLKPASNLKVLTTGSALSLLGPGYRFSTALQYEGVLNKSGVLEGSLYLQGNGDPTLGSPLLEAATGPEETLRLFRLAVQRAGIRHVKGPIIGDASAFGSQAYCRTWQWEDMGNYYAAGAWSLNWHENLHELHFEQTAEGRQPRITGTTPSVPGLSFQNEVTSGSPRSGDNAYIFGAPYQMERYVRGSIPAGSGVFTIKGALPDPPLLFAQLLQQELAGVGILCSGASRQFSPPARERTTIYTHYSPTLASIVERTNMESVNLYCEAMVRAMGWEKAQEGSYAAGHKAIQAYWEERGLSWEGVFLDDGSGLSEGNAVSARFLAAFMRKMAIGPPAVFEPFEASLPVAGRSGSLKNTLKGTAAEGRLLAKTGTLERVRALTGYATTRSGQRLAFCIILNRYEGPGGTVRKAMEQFLLSLCEE